MPTAKRHKKNLIVSYKNLSDNLKELFKETYPEGYNNYLQKFVKPNGEAIFVVPFETTDTVYMVKFEVKIDTLGEDLDKALFDDDSDDGKEEEFAPLSEALDKEEVDTSHRERHLRHGDFEELLDEDKKKKATLGVDKEGLKEALGDDEDTDELDSYDTLDDDEPTDDDFEPTDEDLRGIEEEYLDAEIPPLDATIPEEEMVEIPKKGAKKATKTVTKKAPAKTTAKVTVKAPAKVATKAPTKVTVKAPAKVATKAPAKVTTKATAKATVKAPAKVATKTPAKVTTKTTAKVATKAPAKAVKSTTKKNK